MLIIVPRTANRYLWSKESVSPERIERLRTHSEARDTIVPSGLPDAMSAV